jgi:4-amino-4-deoxy-L-arabinose transferase-like glycosyltransferase
METVKKISLVLIIVLAAILRFNKLASIPPSINWDEAAAGYNAYTIANWGADEYGIKFPLVFKSFADDKHPVHIYITALFVKILGLNEFSTRFSSAFIGTLTVVAVYFLVKEMFGSRPAALFSALFLAISPYHLQFSRGLWEINFAVFFYVLGLLLFYLGLKKKPALFPVSFFSFGLSFFSYHSSKVVVPPTILLLGILYFRDLIKNKTALIFCGAVLLLFTGLTIHDPRILGFARIAQNPTSSEALSSTILYKKTHNTYLAMAEATFDHYKTYFYPGYLFVTGDGNPRNAVQNFGEFYKIDAILVIFGLVFLLWRRSKAGLVILCWILLAPVAAAYAGGPQNAVRAGFMMGGFNILAALGAVGVVTLVKNKIWYVFVSLLILTSLFAEFGMYLRYYYTEYSKKYAIEWQYGMKQVVEYLKNNPDYVQVYMDNIRQQPYIFFLYYLKTPLPDLLKTVRYDNSKSKSYNTVLSFDNFRFGGWDIINSAPYPGVIYVVTPSYYGGLRFKEQFDVKELVKYPSGADAFYIVEGNQ